MVKVGSFCARQTSAGVNPSMGCTVWVHAVRLFSFEVYSFEMHVGRVIHAGSFSDVGVQETFVKVDGICDSCRKVLIDKF